MNALCAAFMQFGNWISELGRSFRGAFASFTVWDFVDIVAVTLFFFFLIRLVRNSRAEQLFKGIVYLLLLYFVANAMNLTAALFFFKLFFDNALVIIIVVFQPEIRRALEQVGHSRNGLFRAFSGLRAENNAEYIEQSKKAFNATAKAMESLQRQKMGALVVFERNTRLGEIVRSGTILEAEPTAALISSIFFNKAPLHDGAVIIRDGKVYAAACILPLSDNPLISRELGTRHRAGVGMSENSDAVVVILSEETGNISIADTGELKRDLTPETLVKELEERLIWNTESSEIVKKLRNRKKKTEKEENA